MTEQTTPQLDADITPAADDFNLDDWINGGSVAHRSVDVYARPDLYADYEDWERRLENAKQRAHVDEASLADSEDDEIVALREEGERIYAQWVASKSTWRIRALDPETEITPLRDAIPQFDDLPKFPEKAPIPPRDHQNGKPSEAFEKRYAAWEERRDAFIESQADAAKELAEKRTKAGEQSDLEVIAAAVTTIEFANGTVTEGVTVEQLRKMKTAIGHNQVNRLLVAALQTMGAEPSIPVPFSQTSSKGTPE